MNLKERLIIQNQKNQKNQTATSNFEPEQVEIYMERTRQNVPLNKNKSVFESSFNKGINTDDNVFDKYAVFK